ncbi:hypothetical protein CVT91_09615 [Candidatus Atribacteria bacterium HGW-Atribacteria-1]|nr:MAG: hypothetical protein CVT91_09615 [Candidatus Atribacteria bacterium HGW-Atribacteria-1]
MREIFEIIKENFILLLGTGLFTYGLFKGLQPSVATYPKVTYHYFGSTSLISLTIGAIFIVIGLIKIKTKKDKK